MEMLSSLSQAQAILQDKLLPEDKDEAEDGSEVPDDDAIKMFVGQVPRSMDEDALKDFFEDFGRVYQLNVLRDKNSGVSRGCCFVTFYKRKHALDAQNALHNVKTMPGMHHAIQMKPADTENRNERKIFVGMVSKKMGEEEIKTMFSQFGPIEDCTVLRDDNGISRGCAFVTFSNRQIAILAIKAMHHSLTMEGCSSPLVVKFADTQKDKEQKKIQQLQTSLWPQLSPQLASYSCPPQLTAAVQHSAPVSVSAVSPATSCYVGGVLGSPLTMGASVASSSLPGPQPVQGVTVGSGQGAGLVSLQQLLQQQAGYLQHGVVQQHYLPQHDTHTLGHGAVVAAQQDVTSPDMSQLTLMTLLQQQQQQQQQQQSSALTGAPLQPGLSLAGYGGQQQLMLGGDQSGLGHGGLVPSYGGLASLGSLHQNGVTNNNSTLAYLTSTGGKLKTPDGSSVKQGAGAGGDGANNLFIYHLPQEFTDADLVTTFQPFGTIVSAKVFIDKQTNLSKCFGFVSYTTAESAQAAIQAMNGFQVGTKRLKVQLKKPKDVSKPY